MSQGGKQVGFALGLVVLGVAGRLLPHAWNATPVMATGIIAGWYLGKRYAISVPLAAMAIGDVFIGAYDWRLMSAVYGSLVLVAALGWTVRQFRGLWTAAAASVIGSSVFFLATNGAVWLFSSWYEPTLNGLLRCYALGLPFYRNALVGDLFYALSLLVAAEFIFCVRVGSLVPAWRRLCYNLGRAFLNL